MYFYYSNIDYFILHFTHMLSCQLPNWSSMLLRNLLFYFHFHHSIVCMPSEKAPSQFKAVISPLKRPYQKCTSNSIYQFLCNDLGKGRLEMYSSIVAIWSTASQLYCMLLLCYTYACTLPWSFLNHIPNLYTQLLYVLLMGAILYSLTGTILLKPLWQWPQHRHH